MYVLYLYTYVRLWEALLSSQEHVTILYNASDSQHAEVLVEQYRRRPRFRMVSSVDNARDECGRVNAERQGMVDG